MESEERREFGTETQGRSKAVESVSDQPNPERYGVPAAAKNRRPRHLPPGAVWRVQAYRINARRFSTKTPLEIRSDGHAATVHVPAAIDAPASPTTLAGTHEFDELVVGTWLHIEQMDVRYYWMRVGGLTLDVTFGRDGSARVAIRDDGRTAREKRGNAVEGT